MNKILNTICIGSVAFAVAASGAALQTETAGAVGKKRAKASANTTVTARSTGAKASVRTGTAVNTHRKVTTGNNFRQRSVVKSGANSNAAVNRSNHLRTNRVKTTSNSNVVARNNHKVRANREANVATNRNRVVTRENRVNRVNRANNAKLNRNNNVSVNRTRNINRTRNVTVNNNWRGSHFAGTRYAAFRNYHRSFHNRDWWHSNYSRVVFVSGGWWAWNAGYWYPAWGYDPAYTYYPYDGPIYTGQAVLGPDQVVVNVQAQLQRDGYYDGPIDGQLGPMTRQAIANFQADNGLAITSAIDEPTLDTLGVA